MRTVLARQWGGELWSSGEAQEAMSFARTFATAAIYTAEEGASGACGCLACALSATKKSLWDAQVSPLLNQEDGRQFLGDDIADNTTTTTTLAIGASLNSTINHTGDLDYVRVSLVAGQTYTFSLASTGLTDAWLDLANSSGTVIASNDDGGITYSSFMMFTATTTGTYYLIARAYDNDYTGSYTLSTEAIDTGNTSPTTFTPNSLPFYSWEEAAVQITRSGASWATSFGAPVTVTYAFRATSLGMPSDVSGFSQFNAAQIAATEAALAAWAAVANITFVRVGGAGYSNNATILFGNYNSGADEAAAFAYLPTTGDASFDYTNYATTGRSVQGDVWVNVSLDYNANPLAGDPDLGYGAQVLLHEIGHALGLSHPGDYNAGEGDPIVYPGSADYYNDTRMFTTMSYFGSSNTGGDLPYSAYIPQLHDIAAIQRLYGANVTTRTGDTIYGFNSNTGVPAYTLTLGTQGAVFVVWDGGGNDTLDLSGYSTNNVIDLRQEGFSSAGPGGSARADYNIAIARGVVIENAIGGGGADTIYGNDANNVLNGGAGIDAMIGGLGNDTYHVNTTDTVTEALNAGTDTVISTAANFTLGANVENLTLSGSSNINGTGNELNNVLLGNAGNNTLAGLAGNDTIDGGAGTDTMSGGLGDDMFYVDNVGDGVNENASEGTDTVYSSVTFSLGANVENLVLLGSANFNGTGNTLNNSITGNAGANTLSGGEGSDTLSGGDGADILDGGEGADTMFGGLGDDTFYVDNAGDVTGEGSALGGIDTVYSSVTRVLGAHIENLTLTGTADINGTGNDLNNIQIGNDGANTLSDGVGNDQLYGGGGVDLLIGGSGTDYLDGGSGGDTMYGGLGDDTFIVDSASDVTGEGQPTGGTDTVLSSVTRSLGANIENLTLTGSANINATGNNLDNILTGNIGNNTLSDGAGNDQLFGGLGNDTLSAGAGTDYLDGGEGADTMFGGLGDDTYVVDNTGDITQEGPSAGGIDTILSSVTRSLGANLENLTLTGTNAINGVGNTLANTIAGNSAANTLTGGGGADAFVFNTALGAGNIDTISDFVVVDDTIHLSNAIFGLGAGALSASAFVIGAAAADASDRIIYDSATGALYFDADGDGAGAAIHFATLGTGLALTSDDFWGFG